MGCVGESRPGTSCWQPFKTCAADEVRTERSPIQSVVLTKFEKETRHRLWLYVFNKKRKRKKKAIVNSAKCETTVHDAFCSLTQAWRGNCPSNCPITLSNYKHDTVLLELESGWWQPITFENFAIVLISAPTGQCTVHVMLVIGHLTQHACVTICVICVLL